MTFSDWVSKWINQLAHIGWGSFIALLSGSLFGLWIGVATIAGFAAVKEFIFDKLTETKTLQGSDTEDFAFWMAGGAIGVAMAAVVRWHLGG